ncbi:hypothetical protein MGN70_014647 [Eutypa lata]|nr:hypothetical protein MGN70_014647 [Eutypa lata]
MASTSAESYFDKVPLEIFLAIVKEIPDIPSLTNCMGLSKSIRKRLIHDLPSTCRAVITNEIGSDFLPIAVSRFAAEHETSGLPRILAAYKENPTDTLVTAEYEDCAIRFFEKYLRGQAMNLISPPSGFTLDTAQALSRFHEVVWDLVDRIINKLSPLLPKSDSLPITPVERARLCRALYIHELSRLVVPFQHEADGARRGLYKKFWKCFAPWENQQVYCVWRVLEELMFDCRSL